MDCPKCGNEMDEVTKNEITIDKCPSCKGVWLDRGELKKIIELRKQLATNFLEEQKKKIEEKKTEDEDEDDEDSFIMGGTGSFGGFGGFGGGSFGGGGVSGTF